MELGRVLATKGSKPIKGLTIYVGRVHCALNARIGETFIKLTEKDLYSMGITPQLTA